MLWSQRRKKCARIRHFEFLSESRFWPNVSAVSVLMKDCRCSAGSPRSPSADVVGYARLMAADQTRSLTVLKSHRQELIDPDAVQYDGRTFKLMDERVLM